MRDVLGADRARRDVVDRRGPRRAVHRTIGEHVALGRRPGRRRVRRRRRARQRRPGRRQAARPGAQARPQEAQPDRGLQEHLRPERALRGASRTSSRSRVVGAIVALALSSRSSTSSPRSSACRRRSSADRSRTMVLGIAQRAGVAYLLIGVVDYAYQRYRHEKSLKMDKQEVKEEHKQHGAPGRGPGALAPPPDGGRPRPHDGRRPDRRRRRHQPDPLRRRAEVRRASSPRPRSSPRARTTSPLQIRELAARARRARRPRPAARALAVRRASRSASMIPEELFHAVAQLLAFVYRVGRRRRARRMNADVAQEADQAHRPARRRRPSCSSS